jgi:single-stranded-DNA-specific exonuclease
MLRTCGLDIRKLAKEARISEITACILVNRGINNTSSIKKFMNSSLSDLYNPLLMKDMDKGTDIIKEAILNGKKIVIYGDYDADGVTSTVILYKALKKCGAIVDYYIPDRELEGYGMCSDRVSKLKEGGTEVILTCDNGISAINEINFARSLGMAVVVTDHHELPFKDSEGKKEYMIPECEAVINPKQKDCMYPFKLLCGAGIAFKFAQVLYKKMGKTYEEAYEFIEYAGIGTICDIVDLIDENRIIVKEALSIITNTNNTAIKALKEVLGINDKKITTYNVGFQIGPCINATGRLFKADLAVELFMCSDFDEAVSISQKLNELNKKRQEITNKSVERIINNIDSSYTEMGKVLVIFDEAVHESIAGIVAGRIKDRYNLPTFIITKGNEMPKGSGRSIEQYDMFKELMKCSTLLERFGGHPMAAGVSLREENIPLLKKQLNENCKLTEMDIIPKLRIDKRLQIDGISFDLLKQIELLEPFGKGNSAPVFAEKGLIAENIRFIGKEKDTLKLTLRLGSNNKKIEAISFGKAEEFKAAFLNKYGTCFEKYNDKSSIKMDIVYYPCISEYNGYRSIQLRINDFRFA